MKKKLSVLDISLLVLGILSIVYGILYYLDIGRSVLGVEIGGLVNGVLIIFVGIFLMADKIKGSSTKNTNKKIIYLILLTLWILVGLFSFVIPSFNGKASSNASIWIGSLLIIFSILTILIESLKDPLLLLYLLLISFGGYVIGSNLLDKSITITIVVVFVLFGLFAIFKSLTDDKSNKGSVSKND